jgi:NAD(P)-dependent dehydrogenase (short-subunit alcohol dehydrogenase family)
MVQLIEELAPLVSSSGGGRICVMGSFTGMGMAKGVLDFQHLRGAEGQSKLFPAEGGYCYSQTKLAQHVFCKHAAACAGFLPPNVTLNVCCPGAVPTDIPGWQLWRDTLGIIFPLLAWCAGARSTAVGIQPMMHLAGAWA